MIVGQEHQCALALGIVDRRRDTVQIRLRGERRAVRRFHLRREAGRIGYGQTELEEQRRALPGFAREIDRSAHQRRQATADGEAEAGAARLASRGAFTLHEGLEQPPLILGRNAGSGVLH